MIRKLLDFKERLKGEIEDAGGIMSFIHLYIIVVFIIWPIVVLYLLLLKPLYQFVHMLVDLPRLGMRDAYKKNFHSDQYEEKQREIERKDKESPLIPAGKWKSFKNREDWPDAYVVDGMAIYGAEGRTLIYVDENVEEFDIPEGVVNLYHNCFASCDKLKRISLPSSLKRIGKRAFYNCVSLTEMAIPESVTILDEEMFMNCSALEKVTLPSHITEIPVGMFGNCRSLKAFCLPKEVKVINEEAFKQCYSLEHIETNDKLELVRENAFENCYSLKEFIMPESMRSVSIGILNGCHSLEHIHFSSQIKDFGGSCCRDCWNIKRITMTPDEHMKSYAKENWKEFAEEIDILTSENPFPETTFWTMGDSLYFGIPRLTNVCLVLCFSKDAEYTVPSFVTDVKPNAFTSCKNMHTLRLSPFIKAGDDPWELNSISYGFIYEYWPQIRTIVFDESLRSTKYAFGLIS